MGHPTKMSPGPFASGSKRPNRKMTPRSYSRRTLMELKSHTATKMIANNANDGLNGSMLVSSQIPSLGGVARSAGVGFRINNPHQVVGYGPNPPEVPPCPR